MPIMHAKDAISASLAECFVTIEGNRYNFMQAINLEAKIQKEKKAVPILGRTGKGNKSIGWKGTGSATFYCNTRIFTDLHNRYKAKGEDVYFDIQVRNYDKTAAADTGARIVVLKDCNINGGLLTSFDAGKDWLEETIEFTFEDFEIKENFKLNVKG